MGRYKYGLSFIIICSFMSCEKLPPYDKRQGYVDGAFNGEKIISTYNTDESYVTAIYDNLFGCENAGFINISYRMAGTISRNSVSIGIANIKKSGGKCFDDFSFYNYREFPPNFCKILPTLIGCHFNFDNCDGEYKQDMGYNSSVHIDKVTDEYITGRMDVYVISKDLPDNFPWTKIQPKTIHLKVDKFVAVKR